MFPTKVTIDLNRKTVYVHFVQLFYLLIFQDWLYTLLKEKDIQFLSKIYQQKL